jgi:hypothetical protein
LFWFQAQGERWLWEPLAEQRAEKMVVAEKEGVRT